MNVLMILVLWQLQFHLWSVGLLDGEFPGCFLLPLQQWLFGSSIITEVTEITKLNGVEVYFW